MQTDVLIVGQGICGTFLSWWLEQAGVSYMVIDETRPYTASKAAAGLINPVTGRRIVQTWMIDELMPFARQSYRRVGESLGCTPMKEARIADFFPTAQMRVAFLKRYEEDPSYLQLPVDEHAWDALFRYELGYGVISPCYLVDLPGLLENWRRKLRERGLLLEEKFDREMLVTDGPEAGVGYGERGGKAANTGSGESLLDSGNGIRYGDIRSRVVIFCDGMESFGSPYFSRLPWAPNKGEALIVEIPELAAEAGRGEDNMRPAESPEPVSGLGPVDSPGKITPVFKKGISLAPWQEGLYWVGSSYEWSFDHEGPTPLFRQRTEAVLQEWLKVPFRTVEHIASVRPATLERRPFVGMHPQHPAIGILNGMGTKGCSLAPYFAHQLVGLITQGSPVRPDADVRRFTKVLGRS